MTTTEVVQTKTDSAKIKVGDVYSRHSFGTVTGVTSNSITVKNAEGKSWDIAKDIVENEFQFADHVVDVEVVKLSRTDLINLITSIPRVAMTVTFLKKADLKEAAALLTNGQGDLTEKQWIAKVKEAMEGEQRTLRGYHTHSFDEHGRLRFIALGESSPGIRLIDPRTINECVTCNKHYVVK